MANGIRVKNSDIWVRYVFREAFSINEKDLGPEWVKFSEQLAISHQGTSQALHNNNPKPSITKEMQLSRYIELLAFQPLDDKKIIEKYEILL